MPDPKRLTDLELYEVSCVDAPANQGARVLMFKHMEGSPGSDGAPGGGNGRGAGDGPAPGPANKKDADMTDKALTQDAVAKMIADAVSAAMDTAKTATDKAVADAVAKAKAESESAVKAATEAAEAANKRATEAEALATAEKAAREVAALEKRAESEFGMLPGTATEKALVLKAIAALPEATAKVATEMLKAGQTALATLATSKGRDPSAPAAGGSAEAELEQKAREVMKAEPALSYADAYDKAITANPDLYTKYLSDRRAAKAAA